MNEVYKLYGDTKNYAHFVEICDDDQDIFLFRHGSWKEIDFSVYEPVVYKLRAGDNRKKTYEMDFSATRGIHIFSEKAVNALRGVLEGAGQIVPVITDSKRKKFFGFFPNKNVYDESIIDLEKSTYKQYEDGKVFSEIVFNSSYQKNDYIFTLKGYLMRAFVTEKFKDLVQKNDLKGFDFSDHNLVKVDRG